MLTPATQPDPAIAPPAAGPAEPIIKRDAPEATESRKALVKRWTGEIGRAKTFHKDTFDSMRAGQDFLSGVQWYDKADSKEKYQANLIQRHIGQRVASLYAKNPTFTCKRRTTLDFKIWDEGSNAFQQLQSTIQMSVQSGQINPATGQPILPPLLEQLLADIKQGLEKRAMLDRVARTMEILMKNAADEQKPSFKRQMKQLIRRVCTCKVGYVKLGYQRQMEPNPDTVERVSDVTQKLLRIEQLSADLSDDKKQISDPEAEELRLLLKELKEEPDLVVSEGITFDFPRANSIIIDPKCTHLTTFLGADYVAHEFIMSPDQVKQIYKCDIGDTYTKYNPNGSVEDASKSKDPAQKDKVRCCVWEIWNKINNEVFTVVDGYADYLKEPDSPRIKLSRFWPFFALAFNETENDKTIFPQSDVELLEPMQREYNRARESLREHRNANKPKTVSADGVLEQSDIDKLESGVAHAHLRLKGLQPGQDVRALIMPMPTVEITAELYDTENIYTDLQRVGGQSDAAVGAAQPGVTATGDSIAESNRATSVGSNIDDLDDLLGDLAESAGQVLLMQMSPETVQKVAGPGAVWPTMTTQEISDQLILTIEAGSSGRPNAAAEMAKLEKVVPLLMQIPGVKPDWLARQIIRTMDADIDVTDALGNVAQSIVSMNSMKAANSAQGASPEAAAQGPAGGMNGAPAPGAPGAGANPGAANMSPDATSPPGAAVPA